MTPRLDARIPDLVSLHEAADILGVHRTFTHRLVQQGELPGLKVGKTWVFRRSVVEKLRMRRTSVPAQPSRRR